MRSFRYLLSIALLAIVCLYQQCSDVQFTQEMFSSELDNDVKETLRDFEPVLAVRGSGCIACHGNINSGFITDMGYGSSYWMGGNSGSGINGFSGAYYGNHAENWRTSNIDGAVIVPATTANAVTSGGNSMSLADYIAGQENLKPASDRASSIIEMNTVYIGAPSANTLYARFQVSPNVTTKFVRNKASSPVFSGLALQPEGYYKNVGELICDGDLLVNGPVLLDSPVINTYHGCRIYSTASVFLQGQVTYKNLELDGTDKTNLQLISSRAVVMGVGTTHCETASYPGKYSTESGNYGSNPLFNRLRKMWTVPNQHTRGSIEAGRTPAQEGDLILADADKIPGGPKDASCFVERREVNLERILVNAPNVQSRYRGNFKGVLIAEMVLGSLGAFKFEFDPVFKEVPVLPLLNQTDFLVVK